MKKLVLILVAAFALAAPRANGQAFNHMSLGPTVGLEGVGIDIAMPIGQQFQLRAGYGIDPIPFSFNVNLGTFSAGNKTVDLNNIPISAKNWKTGTGHLLFDFFPSKKNGFHISAGAFVNNGAFVSAAADLTKVLNQSDWGTLAVDISKNGKYVSTDSKGQLNVDVKHWKLMPYVGIGWGRAIDPENIFRFVFDMGLLVWGSPQVQSYDYTGKDPKTVVITADDLKSRRPKVADLVQLANDLPVCPYVRFSFYFRLF